MTEPTTTLVEQASNADFATTLDRLVESIGHAGMEIFARIDHAAAARAVGMAMPPTVVIFYGNPTGGTPIMLGTPRAALELPLRVLLREDSGGKTWIAFHPIEKVLRDAGVSAEMSVRLQPAQRVLLNALR